VCGAERLAVGGLQRGAADGANAGGASVRIDASGNIILNGTIAADGGNVQPEWGGRSGGAIWINCWNFTGPAGTHLTAKGGQTASGGGRIAVWYAHFREYQGTNSVAAGVNTANGIYNGFPGTYVEVYAPPPQGMFFMVR